MGEIRLPTAKPPQKSRKAEQLAGAAWLGGATRKGRFGPRGGALLRAGPLMLIFQALHDLRRMDASRGLSGGCWGRGGRWWGGEGGGGLQGNQRQAFCRFKFFVFFFGGGVSWERQRKLERSKGKPKQQTQVCSVHLKKVHGNFVFRVHLNMIHGNV